MTEGPYAPESRGRCDFQDGRVSRRKGGAQPESPLPRCGHLCRAEPSLRQGLLPLQRFGRGQTHCPLTWTTAPGDSRGACRRPRSLFHKRWCTGTRYRHDRYQLHSDGKTQIIFSVRYTPLGELFPLPTAARKTAMAARRRKF